MNTESKLITGAADGEVILRVLIDREPSSGYYAQISDAVSGSESDTGGESLAELMESALAWANIRGLELAPSDSLEEIRSKISEALPDDGTIAIRIYASF